MNDISPELKREWIVRALGKVGFEEMPAPGIFAKKHGNDKILVDLNEKQPCAIFIIGKEHVAVDDSNGTLLSINQIIVDAESGVMPNDEEQEGTPEQPDDAQTEPAPSAPENVPAVPGAAQALTPSTPADLSVQTIKKYINDKATDEEAYVFLQLCKARGLNPFLKEAHLIKYSHTAPATMVVGKDAFTRKAEEHKQFDGFEAGIIVRVAEDTPAEERLGTFMEPGETLLGGWAKVYRKDHKYPSVCTVSLGEYSKPGRNGKPNSWDNIPATMIRKVALVQAHREAFSSEMSGMYDQSEMGVEVIT